MNLDKKLARYARQLDNPKYYEKILHILDKADEKHYTFKNFSKLDIIHIYDVIDGYFEVNNSYEKHKQTIKYFNSYWFIITDKKYIVWISQSLLISLSFLFRGCFLLFISKLTRLISPAHFFECENINRDLYLRRGALKAAEFLECDVFDLDEYKIIK